MLKVSVVVPTYRSGEGLDHLVASLDAQTMPKDEFEIVFVDDGSPDETFARLERIQATRPHVRLERIENSGWPCRPRNVGADLAQGEFIAFMDHDDTLYPDALRAAYDYAVANGADVVNGKEARTDDATWAIQTYREDLPQSLWRTDVNALIPMNPHKLYRRAFLVEHDIRFREGGRVMWEDIFFNLQVARHAKVVSTLASVPYYHWVQTKGSGSKGFLRSSPDFWHWLGEVFQATQDELAGDAFTVPREQLIAHQYRSRLLGSFDGRFAKREEPVRDLIYDACRRLQAEYAPPEVDARLHNRSAQLRAHLLRAGERQLLESLPQHDPGIPGWGAVTAARWVDGRLHVSADAEWSTKAGRRHALRRDGDRIVKVLPDDLRAAVPDELLDVTDEIAGASIEFGVRSRDSRITWMLPGSFRVDATDDAGSVRISGEVDAVIDPDTVVFGRALEPGVWDVNVRCELAGSTQQASAVSSLPPRAIVFGDDLRVAYPTADGTLALAVGGDARGLQHIAPDASRAVVQSTAAGRRVRIPLTGVEVQRPGSPEVTVEAAPAASLFRLALDRLRRRPSRFRRLPGRLAVDGDAVELVLELPEATRRLRLRLGGSPSALRWWNLRLSRKGAVRLTPGPVR